MTRPFFSNVSIANPSHRPVAVPVRLSLLVLAAVLASCASDPHRTRSSEYYRDAQLCRAQNPLEPQAGPGTGSTTPVDTASGVDTENYLRCMERFGYRQDAQTDPLLKALAVCRRKAERPVTAARASGGTEPSSGIDRVAFQECLKQRGVEGETGAGPLRLGAPKQP